MCCHAHLNCGLVLVNEGGLLLSKLLKLLSQRIVFILNFFQLRCHSINLQCRWWWGKRWKWSWLHTFRASPCATASWCCRSAICCRIAAAWSRVSESMDTWTIIADNRTTIWSSKQNNINVRPYHTIPYHTIPYHTIPQHYHGRYCAMGDDSISAGLIRHHFHRFAFAARLSTRVLMTWYGVWFRMAHTSCSRRVRTFFSCAKSIYICISEMGNGMNWNFLLYIVLYCIVM